MLKSVDQILNWEAEAKLESVQPVILATEMISKINAVRTTKSSFTSTTVLNTTESKLDKKNPNLSFSHESWIGRILRHIPV